MKIRNHDKDYVKDGDRIRISFEGVAEKTEDGWVLRQMDGRPPWPFSSLPENCSVTLVEDDMGRTA